MTFEDPTLYGFDPTSDFSDTPQLPGDFSTYGTPQYSDAATNNRKLTGIKSMLAILANPQFNRMVSATTGADTLDYGALQGASSYVDPQTGMPLGGGGGAGGGAFGDGSGGGGGNGYTSVYTTPWSDAASRSPDPVVKGIFDAVSQGQDPATIKLGLMSTSQGDQAKLDVYNNTVDKVFGEQSGFQRNQLLGQAPGGGGSNPLMTALQKSGLPNPATTYTADNLPPDIDTSGIDMIQTRNSMLADQYEQLHQNALRDMVHEVAAKHPPGSLPSDPRTYDEFLRQGGQPAAPTGDNSNRNPNVLERVGGAAQHLPGAWDAVNANVGGRLASGAGGIFDFITGKEPDQPSAPARVSGGWNALPSWTKTRIGPQAQQQRWVPNQESPATWQAHEYARAAQSARDKAAETGPGFRNLVANYITQQGRSPDRDALRAQMNFLRQMGLDI